MSQKVSPTIFWDNVIFTIFLKSSTDYFLDYFPLYSFDGRLW